MGVHEANMDDLDAILSGEEPQTEAVIEGEPKAPVRDEQGRFAPKETGVEEAQAEPDATVPPTDKLPKEEYEALRDERRKRQEVERRLAELEAKFQAPQEPQAPPPSIWEDEQGWQQNFGSRVVTEATLNARFDMSEMLARQANPDFEEMKAEFIALAQQNPVLAEQARSDPHPWQKAYQIAKTAKTARELGAVDVDALKAKLREEIMAEQRSNPAPSPSLPQSLADSQSARAPVGDVPQMLSLSDILKG